MEFKKKKWIYKGKKVSLSLDTYRHEGKSILRETVNHPGSVVIIPRLDSGHILLIKQYRHTAGKWIWELPAGTREILSSGIESPRNCAKREIQEEIGYRAKSLRKLCRFYLAPGTSTEMMDVFLASHLQPKKLPQDEDEMIRVVRLTKKEILKMIFSNKITDAKTIAALLFYYNFKVN